MPVLDFKTLTVLVLGPASPRRFAKMHLKALRDYGQKPLVPATNYLKLYRSFQKRNDLGALTDLKSLRDDLDLWEVTEDFVDAAIHIFEKYSTYASVTRPAWDVLDCLAAATSLDKQVPLAVMNKAAYARIPNLTDFDDWWHKP